MRCQKAKRNLALFLDGQLNKKLTIKVKEHLESCSGCSEELNLLKQSWNLLREWKPVVPSPNFKATFWQRVVQEEVSERRPIFVFPRLRPSLVPAFATLTIILVFSIILANFVSVSGIQRLAELTADQDIQMLKELDLAEDFEVIKNLNTLEDYQIIDYLES
jgi:anti-sigma factor RsiW